MSYSEPALAVLGLDLLAVAHPVAVPAPKSSTVVNTNGVNALDLETGTLELVDSPAKRSRGVSTRENVLVHEKTPDEILVLPRLADTSVLHEEDTVVVEHVVNLAQERREVTDTDVFGHLKTGDLVVLALRNGSVAVIHAEDAALLLGNTELAETAVTPGSLVATESDASDLSTVVGRSELGEGTPATAEVEHAVTSLESNLLADNGQLVVLQFLKSLFLVDVGDDTRSVDHARAEEPRVEVITAVVVVADLLLVLRTSVHNDLGHHAGKEKPEEGQSEAEVGPVVTVLHDLKSVAVEVDITVEVLLVEGLHGDLAAAVVLCAIGLLVELEVVLNGGTGVASLLVLAGSVARGNGPEGHEDRDGSQETEEDPGLEATTNLVGHVGGDAAEESEQDIVVERLAASCIGGERGVLDCWVLLQLGQQCIGNGSRKSSKALTCKEQRVPRSKHREALDTRAERERKTHSSAAYTKLGALRSRSRNRRSLDEVGQLLRVLGLVLFFAGHDCCGRPLSSEQRDPCQKQKAVQQMLLLFKYFSTNDTKLCPLDPDAPKLQKAWTLSAS